jgi:hypothetical protein
MDNGTLDIQAALRAKYAELCSRQRDTEHTLKNIEDELVRVSIALDALNPVPQPAESVDEISPLQQSEPIAVAKSVVLTGGGHGGNGSHVGDIKIMANHQQATKPRTAKRRQPKRSRG